MNSYNELITLIDAVINRNGVQAITGQVLNGVLKAMVQQLGAGYSLGGVAKPTDDPGTPEAPVCYFASEVGTYTNFGGVSIVAGELALLCYDMTDGWFKETMYEGFASVGATIDGNVGTPAVDVTYNNGILSFDFRNMKGNPGQDGAAAGFGTIGATIDGNVGTPAVSVQESGPNTAKNLQFNFSNLKGETGVTSVVVSVDNTSGTPQCAVSLSGQVLTLAFTGLKGAQGDTGVSADYPITIVNNLTTNDPTSALSAAQGVQLESEISQLEAEVAEKTYGAEITQLSPAIVSGKYIYNNGEVGTSGGLSYTEPYYLNSGDYVIIKAEGYNQAISILAKVIEEDVSYLPVIISIDTSVREYKYIVTEPGYYASCFKNSSPISITKVVNTPAAIVERITDLNTETTNPVVTIVSGKYINSSGNEGSSAAFNRTTPFALNPAESIVLYATGYGTGISMISQYDGSGYIPLVLSIDSESHRYSYTNISNVPINIVLSYDKTAPVHRYIITDNLTADFGVTLVNGFANVGNKVNGGKYQQYPKATSGKYVYYDGRIASSAPFSMTENTFVFSGSVIKAKAAGYNTAVAMIAEYVPEEGKYTARVISTDSDVHEYTYTAQKDAFFVFSYLTANGLELTITSPSDLVNEVGELSVDVNGLMKNTPGGILSAFDNIVAVGDSLTFSQVYTGSNTARQAYVPYPNVLARIAGNTATIVAQSGASASGIWDNHKNEIVAKTNAIGIVYLGTNEGLTDTVSTDASGDDPDNWANNNTGDYCRIVDKMVGLGYRVVLVRPWTTSGTLADTISAINDVAEKFGVAVMDAPILESKFHLYPDGQGENAVHLNDFGYAVFAQRLAASIFAFDSAMLQRIFPQ